MSKIFRLCAFAMGILSGTALAATDAHLPPHLFLGSDIGWGSVSPYAPPEGTRDGIQFDLKGLGSLYLRQPSLVFDLGLGWQFGKRSGQNDDLSFGKTITRGTFFEGSVRYGRATGWQIGPVFDFNLINDVGLNSSINSVNESNHAFMAGLQIFYEYPHDGYRVRLGGRVLTALNITNRTVNHYQVGIEIGWPVEGANRPKARAANPRAGYFIVQKDRPLKRLKVVLDARRIEFDYDRATLRPDAARRLQNLGVFLARNLDHWEYMKIAGHTDERGSISYNQVLSDSRAAAVRAALGRAGVPLARMESRGYSKNFPLDPAHDESAWQKNRRVEFEFSGVNDMDLIIDGVNQSTSDPETAGDPGSDL